MTRRKKVYSGNISTDTQMNSELWPPAQALFNPDQAKLQHAEEIIP